MTDEWLSTGEVAERLGVNLRTVYRIIDQGRLPAYRFSRTIKVRRSDLEAFIEQARVRPGELRYLYEPEEAEPGAEPATEAERTPSRQERGTVQGRDRGAAPPPRAGGRRRG